MHKEFALLAAQLHELAAQPRPVAGRQLNHQALFAALVQNQLRTQASAEASARAEQVVQQYFQAVLHCRQRALPAAEAALQAADAVLPIVPGVAGELATLFKLSAWGNFHYARQQGAEAVEALRQGLVLSADLERRGLPALIYRRIEQLQNVAAIYFQDQQPSRALTLLRHVLTFVATERAEGLLIDDWDGTNLTRVSTLHEHTLNGVVAHLAGRTARAGRLQAAGHHEQQAACFRDLLRDVSPDTYARTVVHNWLYTKVSYVEEGLSSFLRNTGEFVADEAITPAYDNLRANLLMQAVEASAPLPGHAVLAAAAHAYAAARLRDSAGRVLRLAA